VKLIPHDKTIRAFAEYLPAEIEHQNQTEKDYDNAEYYDEEEEEADDEAPEEPEALIEEGGEADKPAEDDPHADACSQVGDDADKKSNDAESSEESYNSEYYDEEGRYIWGAEGDDWEFYDAEESKEGE
jgi:hypothetical protein